MKWRSLILAITTALVLAVGACVGVSYVTPFQGDGEYTVTFDMPMLRNHDLRLPEFSLSEPGDYLWTFKGYCTWNDGFIFSLNARSDEETEWWNVETRVDAKMRDNTGRVLVEKSSALNSYHARNLSAVRVGERDPAEWETWYFVSRRYGTAESMIAREGIPRDRARYYDVLYERLRCLRTYSVSVQVSEPTVAQGPMVAYIQIQSGWK